MAAPRVKRFLRILFGVAAVYVCCLLALMLLESAFVYQPFPGATEPEKAGLPQYTKRTFLTSDGLSMPYWEHRADGPLILYYHGNGGGLHAFADRLSLLAGKNLHIMAMEYRGYPDAPGKPTESSITADAIAFFDHAQTQYSKKPIALWGYSLGSGFATQVAATREAAALVLEAPFTALDDRGAEIYPIFPVRRMMRNKLRSIDVIHHTGEPLFIMHGGDDLIIPDHHSKRLYEAAKEPKTLKLYPDADHFTLPDANAYDDAEQFVRAAAG